MFLRTNVVRSSPVHFNWFFSPSRFLSSNDLHLWRRREIPSPSSLIASSTLPFSYTHLHEQGAHLPNAPNFYDLSSPLSFSSLPPPPPPQPGSSNLSSSFLCPLDTSSPGYTGAKEHPGQNEFHRLARRSRDGLKISFILFPVCYRHNSAHFPKSPFPPPPPDDPPAATPLSLSVCSRASFAAVENTSRRPSWLKALHSR